MRPKPQSILLLLISLLAFNNSSIANTAEPEADAAEQMVNLFLLPKNLVDDGFSRVSDDWQRAHTPMAIEMLSLSQGSMAHRFGDLLKQKTGQQSENKLSSGDLELPRLPAHRAFWFGWHAAYPDTILIR